MIKPPPTSKSFEVTILDPEGDPRYAFYIPYELVMYNGKTDEERVNIILWDAWRQANEVAKLNAQVGHKIMNPSFEY